jgi:hypothetical protein
MAMPSPVLDATPDAAVTPPAPGPAHLPEDLYCPDCGYNLHALEGIDRCPECGLQIDRHGFARSRIPWVHRRHVGRIRAYWRTVWLATLRPRELAAEAARRVNYTDAQRFRWVTAFVAGAPVMAGLVAAMVIYGSAALFSVINPAVFPGWAMGGNPSALFDFLIPWDAGATWPPVLPLAVLLAFVFVTGVATYWFHPKSIPVVRQNRAIALGYYGCGPLALVSVPALAFIGLALMKEAGLDNQANASWAVVRVVEIFAWVTGFLVVTAFWGSTMVLLSRTTQSSRVRLVSAGLLIPLQWAFCAALVLLVVPWVIGYLRLVVGSLR